MSKVKMFVDEHSTSEDCTQCSYTAGEFSKIIEALNTTSMEINRDFDTLKKIAMGGQNEVKNALAEKIEPQKIAGIMQSPRKIVDTLDLPDLSIFDAIRDGLDPRFLALSGDHLTFNKDKVVFTDEDRANIEEKYTRYAKTDKEKEFMQKVEAARKAMEALHNAGGYVSEATKLEDLYWINRASGKFTVQDEFVKRKAIHL